MNADTRIDAAELDKELDGVLISYRQDKYRYIEGHVAIEQANRIFGYDRWGYEIAGEITLHTFTTTDKQTGEEKTVYAYSAPVKLTVTGAPPRMDIGFSTVAAQTADGHDTAMKGAVTDALKRCLRTFGNQFGNSLYDPRWQPENGRPARAADAGSRTASQAQTQYIEKLGAKLYGEEWIASARDAAAAQWASDGAAETLADLTAAQASKLIDLMKNQTPAQTAVNGRSV